MTDGALSDEDAVRRVLAGDTGLFSLLVERYSRKVFGMGLMFFKNHDDASDFMQDVFIRAYGNLHTLRGGSKFYYWLMRVAYNHGVNMVKAGRNAASLVDCDLFAGADNTEVRHLRSETERIVREAVSALPEKYRVCIDLFFFYGLPYAEISDMTGFPVNTIKSHVSRAKRMLRDSLRASMTEVNDEM